MRGLFGYIGDFERMRQSFGLSFQDQPISHASSPLLFVLLAVAFRDPAAKADAPRRRLGDEFDRILECFLFAGTIFGIVVFALAGKGCRGVRFVRFRVPAFAVVLRGKGSRRRRFG